MKLRRVNSLDILHPKIPFSSLQRLRKEHWPRPRPTVTDWKRTAIAKISDCFAILKRRLSTLKPRQPRFEVVGHLISKRDDEENGN